jgi:hypothetical protein
MTGLSIEVCHMDIKVADQSAIRIYVVKPVAMNRMAFPTFHEACMV